MKKYQFTSDQLKVLIPKVWDDLFALRQELNSIKGDMQAADFVARYILIWMNAAGKGRSVGKFKNCDFYSQITENYPSLYFFRNNRLAGISVFINEVLLDWGMGKFHLHLCDSELEPLHVLELQTQAYRCVSCLLPPHSIETYTHGRDPLAFCLHDLMHAYHFYSNPDFLNAQIGFAKLIKKFIAADELQDLKAQAEFNEKLEYAYSDMNAHPALLLKYTRAIFDEAQRKTRFKKDLWPEIWKNLNIEQPMQLKLNTLNRPNESNEDLLYLTRWLSTL